MIARQWAHGKVEVGVAQKAAVGAHRCVREIIWKTPDQTATTAIALAIVRAAGYAVVTSCCWLQ